MFYGGGPLSILVGALGSLLSVIAAAIAFVVVVGVLVLLVRFLWFGTRAAQLYLAKNGDSARFTWPVKPVGVEPDASPEPPASSAATPATAPDAGPTADETPTLRIDDGLPTPDAPARAPRKPKSPPTA